MSLLETLGAALVLGFVTIPHCLVMCGPVAVMGCARSSASGAASPSWRDGGAYFGARLISYAAVGSLMGWMGAHAFTLLGTDLVGRVALYAVAVTCAWQAFRVFFPARPELVQLSPRRRSRGPRPFAAFVASLVPRRGLGLGLATALFPCGALPAAWAVAASTRHPVEGALAMFVFALASAPALVVAVFGRQLAEALAHRIPRVVQAGVWLSLATLLVVRALATDVACHG